MSDTVWKTIALFVKILFINKFLVVSKCSTTQFGRRYLKMTQYLIFYLACFFSSLDFRFQPCILIIIYAMRITIQKQEIQIDQNQIKRKIILQRNIQNTSYLNSDTAFPQSLASIGTDIRTDLNIQWKSVEQLCTSTRYSQRIQNLEATQYCNNTITECLLILNWFASDKFSDFFHQRGVSKYLNYKFIVYVAGIVYKIFVNSKIPLKDGIILFAEPIDDSIFPTIFQKVIAKVYGSYEAVSDDLVELLELWTGYAVQNFSPHDHSSIEFAEFFEDSFKNNNIVLFRTRNSIRLQNYGINSNKVYILTRSMNINSQLFIQFLELQGNPIKGKFSKNGNFWDGKKDIINELKINKNLGRQNYLPMKSMLGISRQIIILHNTTKYNQNWISQPLPKLKHLFKLNLDGIKASHIMISLHFSSSKCRNCAYLICNENSQIIAGSFKDNKRTNFIAAIIQPKFTYSLFVYCENKEGKPLPVNVTINAEAGWCNITESFINDSVSIQQRAFSILLQNLLIPSTNLSQDINDKSQIRIKSLYREFGLGIISIHLTPQFKSKIQIQINKDKLIECGIQPLNFQWLQMTYEEPCNVILLFKFKNKFKQCNHFPPPQTIKVLLHPKRKIKSLFD